MSVLTEPVIHILAEGEHPKQYRWAIYDGRQVVRMSQRAFATRREARDVANDYIDKLILSEDAQSTKPPTGMDTSTSGAR